MRRTAYGIQVSRIWLEQELPIACGIGIVNQFFLKIHEYYEQFAIATGLGINGSVILSIKLLSIGMAFFWSI